MNKREDEVELYPSIIENEEEVIKITKREEEVFKIQLGEKNESSKEIELIFFKLKDFTFFKRFLFIKELTLCHCSLESLKGLDNLNFSLEILRIVGCNLTSIDKQISRLRRLKSLSLGENSIKEIKNLHNCIMLKSLYLYSNGIRKIEFLQDCLNLRELDLSDNLITKIENLDSLSELKTLLISGNRISDLNHILHLKTIISIKTLKFDDENYWPNPICELSDYHEFILTFLLPTLSILDTNVINYDKGEVLEEDNITIFNNKCKNYNEIHYESQLRLNRELELKKEVFQKVNLIIENYLKEFNNITNSLDEEEKTFSKYISLFNILFEEKIELEFNQIKEYFSERIENNNLNNFTISIENTIAKFKNLLEFFSEINKIILKINNFTNIMNKEHEYRIIIQDFMLNFPFFKNFLAQLFTNKCLTFPFLILRYEKIYQFNYSKEPSYNESFFEFNKYKFVILQNYDFENQGFNFLNQGIEASTFNIMKYFEILISNFQFEIKILDFAQTQNYLSDNFQDLKNFTLIFLSPNSSFKKLEIDENSESLNLNLKNISKNHCLKYIVFFSDIFDFEGFLVANSFPLQEENLVLNSDINVENLPTVFVNELSQDIRKKSDEVDLNMNDMVSFIKKEKELDDEFEIIEHEMKEINEKNQELLKKLANFIER